MDRTSPLLNLSLVRLDLQLFLQSSQHSMVLQTTICTRSCLRVSPSNLFSASSQLATKLLLRTTCRKCLLNSGHRAIKCSHLFLLEASTHRQISKFNKCQDNWSLTKLSRISRTSLVPSNLRLRSLNKCLNSSSSALICRMYTTCKIHSESNKLIVDAARRNEIDKDAFKSMQKSYLFIDRIFVSELYLDLT